MINTIVTDMDGTLLVTKGDQIEANNKAVLLDWQKAGKKLFLATGRLDLAILPFIHELKITLPVISCNGGLVRDFSTGEILYKSSLARETIEAVLAVLSELEVDYHIYTTERILGPSNTGKIAFFNEQNKQLPDNEQVPITLTKTPLEELSEGEFPLKILAVDEDENKRKKVKEALAEFDLSVMSSGKNLVDIMNKGIDKAHGLCYLAEHGYLDLSETAAFGDNENDVGMIELAKVGVAMGNGIELAREKADFITTDNDAGGLAQFVRSEILKG
ncbi:HAD family hydrolase [Listeria valentina]|uniref:HAD family hydrolase n=1 Tax=Listeria valentina TaxID=2705293 RepID=UPI001430ADA1|nr:HAD family hydrolase [Listeria valentina]